MALLRSLLFALLFYGWTVLAVLLSLPISLFGTKAIRGWLANNDQTHCRIVAAYFELAGGFGDIQVARRTTPGYGDPLYAVWAAKADA